MGAGAFGLYAQFLGDLMLFFLACSPVVLDIPRPVSPEDSGDSSVVDSTPPPSHDPLELCINEWMPNNQSVIADADGGFAEWIELHNPGAVDVDLSGWSVSGNTGDMAASSMLSGTLAAGDFLLLWADGQPDQGADHLSFELVPDHGLVSLYAPDGRGSVVTYGVVSADFSVARETDCCTEPECLDFVFRGTPGASNVVQDPVVTEILPLGSQWRYLDSGVSVDGWKNVDFDDSAWAVGAAPLGYGDSQVTQVGFGVDPNAKNITTYFRRHVSVQDVASLSKMRVGLVRDDGAVLYVNGREALRNNMPDGLVTASMLALSSMGGTNETTPVELDIPPDLFVEGDNTLSVELHQYAADSSDISFDMFLQTIR